MGAKPTKEKKKMAICFVFFNPAQSKRMLMNYLYIKNSLDLQGLPVFTIELVYKGKTAQLPDAVHVNADSVMFHKENLYRILETTIPSSYTKLAFLDADVYFKDASWYYKVSALLKHHDVVQPFETAHWLDLTYKKTLLTRKTVVLNQKEMWDFAYHPGFAWCMRRDWYTRVGFFDYAVSGSGDTLSSAAWLQKKFPAKFQSLPLPLVKRYTDFQQKEKPRITYLKDEDLYHLYHGSRENRQYSERHAMLKIEGDIDTYLDTNEDGVFVWKDTHKEKWNPIYLRYFINREDDSVNPNDLVLTKLTS